jgi:hypothetical protein
MSTAVLTKVAPAASTRILADVTALVASDATPKESALERLEQAIGRDFADRLVAALSDKSGSPDTELLATRGDLPPRRRTNMKIAAAATSETTNASRAGTSDGERTEPHVEEEDDRPDERLDALVDARARRCIAGDPTSVARCPAGPRIHRAGGAFVHSTR